MSRFHLGQTQRAGPPKGNRPGVTNVCSREVLILTEKTDIVFIPQNKTAKPNRFHLDLA